MINILGTLSSQGTITDNNLAAIKIFEYFLVSEYSQTFFYKGDVASLKYLISKYKIKDGELASEITNTLKKMYERYFDEADIHCDITQLSGTNTYTINIVIDIPNKNIYLDKRAVVNDNGAVDFGDKVLLYKKRT